MGVYEATPTTVTDGDLGVVGITENRLLKVSVGNTVTVASHAVTNAGTFAVQVDSSSLPTGAATSAKQDTVIGHLDGVETLLGTIDTDTGNISTKIDTLAGAVTGTEMQVDILTIAAGDNNIGNVDIASIAAGDNNIGNVDIASALPAGTNAIGKLAANSGVDIGDVDVTSLPRSQSGPGQPGTAVDSYTHAAINLSAGNNQVLVSSAASKQIWVYGIGFTLSVAGSASFQDEDDTAITGVMPFAALSGMAVPPSGNFSMPIWKLATDKDLEVDLVTADMDGWIDYAILSV
jgi:hypothetical protein